MLRIIQNSSPSGAKSYYSTADYYSEGQELVGVWRGKGAERLGLSGEIEKRDWDALCDNTNPDTGKRLTVRRKGERRVGYDFTFAVPKSVSVVYALTKDDRILDAFRDSVDETMREVEAEMKTRVRAGGKNEDRTTGNMAWGEYIHFTSRPVDGEPDPQLHAHCFVFNTTFDPQENRWKAGQFGDLKRDAPYFGAVFHARMASRMEALGLPVERTRNGWELAGVPRSVVGRFSRRTAQIEALAKDLGITNPKEKDQLGATTRGKKVKQLSFADLQGRWKARMPEGELRQVDAVMRRIDEPSRSPSPTEQAKAASEAVRFAVDHWFARSSTVPERKLLAAALQHGVGKASKESVEKAIAAENLIVADRWGERIATTQEVLAEEKRMLDFARKGRGTGERLGGGNAESYQFKEEKLSKGQRGAVLHVLGSRDRVTLVRGAAGVGKTTMMKEAVEALEANGNKVFTFAPSADASRGELRETGFAEADTVARLLKDEQLQSRIGQAGKDHRDVLIWVDEAGLLSTKDTAKVFNLAKNLDARVILSGDRRQHGSVERGAALRLLETEAGLIPSEIKEIQRQKGEYKALVHDLSEGRTERAFKQLDELKWIKEVPDSERYEQLASDYVDAVKSGKTTLVVSPTHREGERITAAIRERLRTAGRIGKKERTFSTLENAGLTQAQLRDPLSYRSDDVLVFHQNAKGHSRGERVAVDDPATFPLDQADRFQAFHTGAISVAAGDRLRITRNGFTADKKHALNNGAVYTVKGFTPRGNLVLNNNWTVAKDFGHIAHGYALTSHASQGKSVQRVFVGMSSHSFRATSKEGFYVAISRGKEKVTVYTDDKNTLLEAVKQSDERLSATELVRHREREQGLAIIRSKMMEPPKAPRRTPSPNREHEWEREELQA